MRKETFIEEVMFGQSLEGDEKEAQEGEIKTGLCVLLIDGELCTLRERIKRKRDAI